MSDAKLIDRIQSLSPRRRDLLMRALQESKDAIAVVGVACRFPGAAEGPEALWAMLDDGVDAVREVPPDRWDAEQYYDPDPAAPGKMITRWGGFLDRVDGFDADFFGISPREAVSMDPQQRMLLEVSWEALDHAGIPRGSVEGTTTGVFLGVASSDYGWSQSRQSVEYDIYAPVGLAHSVFAGRLSYLLDLHGPSLAVDTACSSSLVAVHLACQSLRLGESDRALVGGVSVILEPALSVSFTKAGFLSPDGRCKAFDASADGFARGEGCGVAVLERLQDALEAGHDVLAIVRGSAVNQDGRSAGLTAPNGLAQRDVIARALESARVEPAEVGYVEAHGTGTPLGDPIEIEALSDVIGRAGDRPCSIGSIKSNIGHLEAAAGIAGFLEAVLALDRERIPAHLHFERLNPNIRLDDTRFEIPTSARPWPRGDHRRIAAVSSFGFSGTNAHVVLEEAPRHPVAVADSGAERRPVALPLSARDDAALRVCADRVAAQLASDLDPVPPAELRGLARRAAVHLTHHQARLCVVGESPTDLAQGLRDFAGGDAPPHVAIGRAGEEAARRVAFVFSGQGSQWRGMGCELYESEPVYRAAFDEVAVEFRRETGDSLLALLRDADALEDTQVAQPAIFAVQRALARLWRHWGALPVAVVGHSVGEIAAAHEAGVLSLEDAVRIVVNRGQIMQSARGRGRMLAVELDAEAAAGEAAAHEGRVAMAAHNAPGSSVLAGDEVSLKDIESALAGRGVRCRWVRVDYAFHSPQMDVFRTPFVAAIGDVQACEGDCPIVSTVTGAVRAGREWDAAYWGRNLREPVQFASAVEALLAQGCDTFVEIGGHPVLATALHRCLDEQAAQTVIVGSLRRDEPQARALLESVGELHVRGLPIAWRALYDDVATSRRRLPSYPWQHRRYWFELPEGETGDDVSASDAPAPLLTLRWRAAEPPASVEPTGDRWLVLAHRQGIGRRLRALLKACGEECVLASPGKRYKAGFRNTYEFDPTRFEDYARLIEEAIGASDRNVRGVVDLLTLDAAEASAVGAQSPLHLSRALAEADLARRPRVWVATRGACPVTPSDEVGEETQVRARGLSRGIAISRPELRLVHVDLDPDATDPAETLFEELKSIEPEDRIALRGGSRHVERLAFDPRGADEPPDLAGGTAIVVSLAGSQGSSQEAETLMSVAPLLAELGAARLILLESDCGESSADGPLASAGLEVVRVRVDVADTDAVRAAVEPQVSHARPISATWLLGVGEPAELRAAAMLETLTCDHPIALQVTSGPATALLGVEGPERAATAELLVAGAWRGRTHGRRALHIATGETRDGAERLRTAVSSDAPCVLATTPERLSACEAIAFRPLLAELAPDTGMGPAEALGLEEILDRVLAIWREVLGVEQLGPDDNFFELGGSSLLATQIVSRLGRVFAVDIPLRHLLERPTAAALAETVRAYQSGEIVPTDDLITDDLVEVARAAEEPIDVDALSDEDVDALLGTMLEED